MAAVIVELLLALHLVHCEALLWPLAGMPFWAFFSWFGGRGSHVPSWGGWVAGEGGSDMRMTKSLLGSCSAAVGEGG